MLPNSADDLNADSGPSTAAIKLVPAVGRHSYNAVFAGITAGDAEFSTVSSSGAASLTVTGTNPTTTGIAQSGSPGNYTLTATVTGAGTTSGNLLSFTTE
jgi:hypothetical protein